MKKAFLLTAIFLVLAVSMLDASVGIGVSPSKSVLQVESGTTQTAELLVFNSGDAPMQITLTADGDIAQFTTIEPSNYTILPEPMPHTLPIKNGRTFTVTFKPPASSEKKTYLGMLSAVGNLGQGSTLGGSVSVASQVELQVLPAKSFLDTIPPAYWVYGLALLVVAAVLYKKRKSLLAAAKAFKDN